MKQFTAFLKKLQLRQILTLFLAGLLLFLGTACNSGNVQGARPENPPVQAGGNNNPYKAGGDSYTKYKASTDPGVNSKTANQERDRADAQLLSNQLVATKLEKLYPGAEEPAIPADQQKNLPLIDKQNSSQPQPGGLIQREPNLGERVGDRLEAVKEAVQEATGFIKDKADEAGNRPELQSNPALHK